MSVTADDALGATIAKWRLVRLLKIYRTTSRYTAGEVCDRLSWDRDKVGRIEKNEFVKPSLSQVRDLARLYGLPEVERDALLELAKQAGGRAWWRGMPEVFGDYKSPGYEYPGFEADASAISLYMPLILPNLVATEPYIRALLSVGHRSEEQVEQALEARLRRRRILDRVEGAPTVHVVVTEAALAYEWGTPTERRAQLGHLTELSKRDNVVLRLLTFAGGPHPGMSSLINVFEYPSIEGQFDIEPELPPIVFLENDDATQEVKDLAQIHRIKKTFSGIEAAALSPADTRDHLGKLAAALE